MIKRLRKHLKITLSVLFVVCLAAGLTGYSIYKDKFAEKDDYVKVCQHAKRIHKLFISFNEDYMGMPGPEAVEIDPELAGFSFDSANGYLGQLLVAMNENSEESFCIPGCSVCPSPHPDNVVAPISETLTAGENGWAYFKNRDLTDKTNPPLLVPGWNPKTKAWDDPIWSHGIPVLHVDGSIILYQAPENSSNELFSTTTDALPFSNNDPDLIQPLTH